MSPSTVYAAEPFPDHRQITKGIESTVISGIGTSNVSERRYEPILLIWHIGVDLKTYFPSLENKQGSLSVYFEPQVNPSYSPDQNIEFGLGVGIQYRYPFTESLSGYVLGSTGPHYISLVSSYQANGFIFSDTLGCGFYYFLQGNSALNLGYRFRHLSNASLAQPNNGINTNFITLGYAMFF